MNGNGGGEVADTANLQQNGGYKGSYFYFGIWLDEENHFHF